MAIRSFSPKRAKKERGGKREPQCATINYSPNSRSRMSGVLFYFDNKLKGGVLKNIEKFSMGKFNKGGSCKL